eukprot:TRINITY_DN1139_c0_g1_i24.p1 TRINITY_DN1139_c0_g1~~TRINITY_DN1139_c0_g1_i24.p1  ORF type:complete len:981 (+),score=308.39 TRINITY_DN1139_c0_g1_i24:184-2943(+)
MNSDLFPGTLEDSTWRPEKCTFAEYTPDMMMECLRAVPYLSIGDSLGEQVYTYIRDELKKAGYGEDVPMRQVWSPSTSVPYFQSDRNGKNQNDFMTQVAEFATISIGAWDIGVHWCGTDEFYDGLKAKVLKYKALLKPGARLALYNIHYIYPDKCGEKSTWCRTCNPIGKVTAYREIVQMVAACTSTGLLDTYPITKEGRNSSIDGLHYRNQVVKPKANIVMNMMCGSDVKGNNKLGLWYPNIECNEAEAKARWRRDPVANVHSEGCPDYANKYGCPNDGGAAAQKYLEHEEEKARQKAAEEAAKAAGVQTNVATNAPQKEEAGTELPLCKKHEDLFPGKLHDFQWVPEKCRLKFYTKQEIAQCLERKPFAAIGDAIGEQFVFALRSGGANVSAKAVWSPSMQWNTLTMSHKTKINLMDYVTKEVEYAILSFGMWDIGVHWCGVEDFYHKLKAKILKYRSMLKPSAEMVLHNLHYINTEKSAESWVKDCNPHAKLVVYREMVQMAAACTGTKMINTFPLTLEGSEHTRDGVHYNDSVVKPKVNILMNMMCGADGEGGDRLEPWVPPMECNEEAAMARWLAVPDANKFSEGCPDFQNEYGCPNDGGAALQRNKDYRANLTRTALEKVDTARRANHTGDSGKEMCRDAGDLYPGEVVDGQWEPRKCSLYFSRVTDYYKCLVAKPLVVIGDSVAEQLYNMFLRKVRAAGAAPTSPMPLKFIPEPTAHFQSEDDSFLSEAKAATLSLGVWDAGVRWCGTDNFYTSMKRKIAFYKERLPEGAPFYLQNIHYVNMERCNGPYCSKCYTRERLAVYREMIEMLAVCTGSHVIDIYNLTLSATTNTQDGVHYGSKVQENKANILLNMMCGRGASNIDHLVPVKPSVSCDDEEASLARWRNDAKANDIEGCPRETKAHKCPEGSLGAQ